MLPHLIADRPSESAYPAEVHFHAHRESLTLEDAAAHLQGGIRPHDKAAIAEAGRHEFFASDIRKLDKKRTDLAVQLNQIEATEQAQRATVAEWETKCSRYVFLKTRLQELREMLAAQDKNTAEVVESIKGAIRHPYGDLSRTVKDADVAIRSNFVREHFAEAIAEFEREFCAIAHEMRTWAKANGVPTECWPPAPEEAPASA